MVTNDDMNGGEIKFRQRIKILSGTVNSSATS